MNAPADSTISIPELLFQYAEFLSTLDDYDPQFKIHSTNSPLQDIPFLIKCPQFMEFFFTDSNDSIDEPKYYDVRTTNSERVLAVLMLREMILSGDA